MSYEAALQRISDIRSQFGDVGATSSATATDTASASATTAAPGAFDAQLASQKAQLANQQTQLSALSTGGDSSGSDTSSSDGSSDFSQYGLPVLTVADQYRAMGLTPTTAAGFDTTGSGTGARMVALAEKEVGVTENNGSNDSPRIREYRTATTGAENSPGPWCAYFVSYIAKEAGAPVGANGNGTGYVPTLEAWGKQQGRFSTFGQSQPKPGDIAIFNWNGGGTPDHTGIVEKVDPDGTIHTIEGNSSDAVSRRTYPTSTNDISGFVSM